MTHDEQVLIKFYAAQSKHAPIEPDVLVTWAIEHLDDGGSIELNCSSSGTYNKARIIHEQSELHMAEMLANASTMRKGKRGMEAAMATLAQYLDWCDLIVTQWVLDNFSAIAAIRDQQEAA